MATPSTMGDYRTKFTMETFSFLPPLTQDEIYDQVAYIIAQGWTPAVEHETPGNATHPYWQ
ncbi:MAG: ribulose bisphosphate carboxylase small subunit, partial [Halothiobacillaceae bacterium]